MVHVVFGGEDREAWWIEPDLKVLRGGARQRAQIQEGRSRRGDRDARGTLLQLRHAALAERARHADGIRPGLRNRAALDTGDGAALQAALEVEQRNRAAVLFERDRQRGESSAGRFDDDVERAGLADDALGPFDSDRGRRAAAGDPIRPTPDHENDEHETGKPAQHLAIEPQNRLPDWLTRCGTDANIGGSSAGDPTPAAARLGYAWRYRLTVRTDGSQPSNRGSIPRTATILRSPES